MGKLNGVPFDLPCIPVYVSISVVSGSGSPVIKIITCVPIPVAVSYTHLTLPTILLV